MLPETIEIPAVTASAIEVCGEPTALDFATMLAVAWYGAQRDDEHVDVPEQALREALLGAEGVPDLRRDDKRLDRLADTILFFDGRLPDVENGVRAPTIQPDDRRTLIDGKQRWNVDPGLRDAFRVQGDEPAIAIPSELLRRARCRYSTLLYIKIAAMIEGALERKWIRKATEDKLLLRVPIQEVRKILGFEGRAADLGRHALEPAIGEINTLSDLYLDATLVRAPSRRGIGKVMAVDILIGKPVLVRPRPRVRQPKVEMLPDNVVRLKVPRRITRGVVVDKSDGLLEF